MDDEDLEERIRSLRPVPLPEDLKIRLSAEPIPVRRPARVRHIPMWSAGILAGAACVTILLLALRPGADEDAPVSVLQTESILLATRTLEVQEYQGQVWELEEREWRHVTVALTSATPIRVRSTKTSVESVWVPVDFQ